MDSSLRLILFLFIFSFGCQEKLSPKEYKSWIENKENGLLKSKKISSFQYVAMYSPPEYKLIISNSPEEFATIKDIDKELMNYNKDLTFNFKIKNSEGVPPLRYNLLNEEEYYARLEYMNNQVINDFFILKQSNIQDTIRCKFVHMERDFGLSPEIRLQLSFGENVVGDNIQLCYNDRMFDNGMIKFIFEQQKIKNLPTLIKD